MATQQVVSNSSNEVAATQVAASTGASGGSAGNNTTTGASGSITSATPVVAPKGFRSALQQMLQGWQEVIPSDSTFASRGGSFNQAAVLAQLQGYLGVYKTLDTSATAANGARAQVRSQLSEAKAYYASLKAAVITFLGGQNSPQLASFGLKPRKARAKATAQQLAVRAAKAKATRALRGTKGSVQKAGVKSGPMQFVEPVSSEAQLPASATTPTGQQSAPTAVVQEQQSAPVTTVVASTAPPNPTPDASPPGK